MVLDFTWGFFFFVLLCLHVCVCAHALACVCGLVCCNQPLHMCRFKCAYIWSFFCLFYAAILKKIELRAKLLTPHSKKKDEVFNPKIWFANLWLAHVSWTSTKSERAGETCNLITTCKKMNLGFNLWIYEFIYFYALILKICSLWMYKA